MSHGWHILVLSSPKYVSGQPSLHLISGKGSDLGGIQVIGCRNVVFEQAVHVVALPIQEAQFPLQVSQIPEVSLAKVPGGQVTSHVVLYK